MKYKNYKKILIPDSEMEYQLSCINTHSKPNRNLYEPGQLYLFEGKIDKKAIVLFYCLSYLIQLVLVDGSPNSQRKERIYNLSNSASLATALDKQGYKLYRIEKKNK